MRSAANGLVRLAGVCLLVVVVAGPAADGDLTPREVYDQTLRATALVVAGDGTGSGWLADPERKLLVTSRHVVDGCETVDVYFPMYRKGKPVAEWAQYLKEAEPVRGRVVSTDARRDLALVVLDSVPATARGLKLAADGSGPGDRVHAVGNANIGGARWSYIHGTVRQTCRVRLPGPDAVVDTRMVLLQLAVNPGDSGGPLVNDDGELVGVVTGFFTAARDVTISIHVAEVKVFLAASEEVLAAEPDGGQ